MTTRRKLIEVALPLDAINAASAREKSIRHGHPSTLHLWWARRPLAACRAVLFAQLVDDPSSLPEEFPTEEEQDVERQRLFGIIEELVKWENTTNEEVLNAARAEILKSTDGNPPPILDPFAGGGSIPLEAQRLGLEAHASDLNPVAVLINKALIEIPPKWADMPPVHPDAEQRTHWKGAEGLAEDVRLYGKWMRDEAEKRIGHLYPKATLEDGSEANVIAWIWARTVTCPNPACGATMPLASSLWLCNKKGRGAWARPLVSDGALAFEVVNSEEPPPSPPKVGRGARFRCPECSEIADETHVRQEGLNDGIASEMMAIVAQGLGRRIYVSPTDSHRSAAMPQRPEVETDVNLSTHPQYMGAPRYGMSSVSDLFTARQLVTLNELSSLLAELGERVEYNLREDGRPAEEAGAYASALVTYLAFAVSKMADRGSTLCTWYLDRESTKNTFSRQVLQMTWDYVEINPLLDGTGTLMNASRWVAKVIEALPARGVAVVRQADAADLAPMQEVISTDPPYYDNVPYADLSDYFYVWLRSSLGSHYGELFTTIATPKSAELVADTQRLGGRAEAEKFFEEGFVGVFERARLGHAAKIPMTVFYAFKQSEVASLDGLVSTGWSTVLEGLLQAGWAITATWPVRTELANRMRGQNSNALASSVVLACRPRDESAGLTDRQGFVRALHDELPDALHDLQKAHIAPVDLRQAAVGPGMAVFSRHSRVVEADGERMRVRTALGLINQVLDQVLSEQEASFDPETRWAIQWFSQFFEDEGPYGTAEQLATAMAIAVDAMVESGILESGGGKVRLLGRDEYPDEWDPTADSRKPVWEACQHLVKRLEDGGETAAGLLLAELGGMGESAQLLAYRLYTICEQTRPSLAGPYNALVAAWPQIQQHATMNPTTEPIQQTFDG